MAAAQKYPRMRLQFVQPAFNSDNGAAVPTAAEAALAAASKARKTAELAVRGFVQIWWLGQATALRS